MTNEKKSTGTDNQWTVELKIPAMERFEKVAMESAAEVAREMGFSAERIADLKTAVSEACLNAIEHGVKATGTKRLMVEFRAGASDLQVSIHDPGKPFDPTQVKTPDISRKVSGDVPTRGWGMFLIRELVDELEIEPDEESGKTLRMIIELEKT